MTDTLTDFVKARLDEDEATARAAKRGPWHADGGHVYATHPTDEVVDYAGDSANHITRHDPARVLAQVAAMRAVVAKYESWLDWAKDRPDDPYPHAKVSSYEKAVLALAAIWSSHPDYDPAWAPEGE